MDTLDNLTEDGHVPKLRKLQGLSNFHLDFFTAVHLEYPPRLHEWPEDIQHISSIVVPTAAEALIFGEATEPWPEVKGTMQFEDLNPSLQMRCRSVRSVRAAPSITTFPL